MPNLPRDISSWAFEKAQEFNLNLIDNRAKNALCYCPEYTFVEKLQTISTKFRLQQENKIMPVNFLRHYYDIYKLLENERILSFIGSKEYTAHKQLRFRTKDEINIKKNPAFALSDSAVKQLYSNEFKKKSALYFENQPSFIDVLQRITRYIEKL